MSVEVRTGLPEDVSELADALARDTPRAHTRQRWREHTIGHREMLVALLDGRLAGCVGISVRGGRFGIPGCLRLLGLDVGPSFRRRGVGSALVRAVEDRARRDGTQRVQLEVAVENDVAIDLYEKLGYRREGDQIVNRWMRGTEDGASEVVEEPSWVMVREV